MKAKLFFTPKFSSLNSEKLKGIIIYKLLINGINSVTLSLYLYSDFKLLPVILMQITNYYIMFVFVLILKVLLKKVFSVLHQGLLFNVYGDFKIMIII